MDRPAREEQPVPRSAAPWSRRPWNSAPLCRGLLAVLCCAHLLTAMACATRNPAFRASPRHVVPQSGLSPQQAEWLDGHCPAGAPRLLPDFDHGPITLIVRAGYALSHSSIDKIARWVCERVGFEQLQGDLPRTNPFRPDPDIAPGKRAELQDYRGSGFDRGHMAPAGNQTVDRTLKDQTFYLSNMAPQVGRQFNQGVWRILEDWARDRVTATSAVRIVTGGFFYDPEEEDPETADGVIPYETIGPGAVAVPTHFYKIVARQDPSGEWEAIAFVMENRAYPDKQAFRTCVRPIRWIEERAGIDFFSDLDPAAQDTLETATPPIWP